MTTAMRTMEKKRPNPVEKAKGIPTAKKPSKAKAKPEYPEQASTLEWQVHDTRDMTPEQISELVKTKAKKVTAKPKAESLATANKIVKSKPKKKATKPTSQANASEANKTAQRGRPTIYTPEIAAEICRRMAAGESVRKIGEDENMPSEGTIRGWALDDKEGFFSQYTRAIQIRAMRWAEETVEIADDGSNDTYIDPETGEERINHEIVARSRLRVDTRKWITSKVLPKIYGDKLDVNHGLQPENPLASLIQRIAGTGLPVVKEPKE